MFVVTIVMIVVCAYLNAWTHTGHNRYTKFIYTETKPCHKRHDGNPQVAIAQGNKLLIRI